MCLFLTDLRFSLPLRKQIVCVFDILFIPESFFTIQSKKGKCSIYYVYNTPIKSFRNRKYHLNFIIYEYKRKLKFIGI